MTTLLQKQILFTKCLGELIRYAGEQGYEFTMGESHIATPRKGVANGVECPKCRHLFNRTGFFDDKVHLTGGLHYDRLAVDMNLFIEGSYISDGAHKAWKDLGEKWESLDPLCTWGGRFRDANHFSITHGGKK
jgi:hypothetical protein